MGRLIVLALLLTGCAAPARLVDPIRWEPFDRYHAEAVQALVTTEPVRLLAGDQAPFDGFLMTRDDLQRLKDELRRCAARLDDAYGQVDNDRAHCSQMDGAQDEALRVCREGQTRAYGAGVGTGMGLCGAIGFAAGRVP